MKTSRRTLILAAVAGLLPARPGAPSPTATRNTQPKAAR